MRGEGAGNTHNRERDMHPTVPYCVNLSQVEASPDEKWVCQTRVNRVTVLYLAATSPAQPPSGYACGLKVICNWIIINFVCINMLQKGEAQVLHLCGSA